MSVNEAQRLRTLEEENRRLKTLVADDLLPVFSSIDDLSFCC